MFLDRSYLLPKGDTLQEQAFSLFRTIVCEDSVLRPKIVMGACELVHADRNQQQFDKDLFKFTLVWDASMDVQDTLGLTGTRPKACRECAKAKSRCLLSDQSPESDVCDRRQRLRKSCNT